MIEKAIDDLRKFQIKKEKRQKKKIEDQQKLEEKRQRQQKEAENRERWLTEKNYEFEKKVKEKAAQKEFEKLKERQKRELVESKSRAAYEKWLKNKKEMMKQQNLKEKQHKVELREKAIERQRLNEDAYHKWMHRHRANQTKQKIYDDKPVSGLEDYCKRLTGASPSYVNPVPWNGVLDDAQQNTCSRANRESSTFQSPPLLWKDYEERFNLKEVKMQGPRKPTSRMRLRP